MEAIIISRNVALRHRLRRALRKNGITSCAEARSANQQLAALKHEGPDFVLLDLQLPGWECLWLIEHFSLKRPPPALLGIMPFKSSFVPGLPGLSYVCHMPSSKAISNLVRRMLAVARSLERRHRPKHVEDGAVLPLMDLSPRQKEILRLLASGIPRKEVAEILHCSVSTINTHCERISTRVGLRKVTELIDLAMRCGMGPEIRGTTTKNDRHPVVKNTDTPAQNTGRTIGTYVKTFLFIKCPNNAKRV